MNTEIISKALRLENILHLICTFDKKISVIYHITTELMEHVFKKNSEELPKAALRICTIHLVKTIQISDQEIKYFLDTMKKNSAIHSHSTNVALLSSLIGKKLLFTYEQLFELTYAALLHDIGKIRVETKLFKKSNISHSEFELMKEHPEYSCLILKNNGIINHNILNAVLHHHEKPDGSGYPKKLRKNDIHEFARIIHVCDVFDTLTNQSFGNRFTCYETLVIVKQNMKHQVEQKYVDILINLMHNIDNKLPTST